MDFVLELENSPCYQKSFDFKLDLFWYYFQFFMQELIKSEHVDYIEQLFFQSLEEDEKLTEEELAIKNVGKQDPKRHIGEEVGFDFLKFFFCFYS